MMTHQSNTSTIKVFCLQASSPKEKLQKITSIVYEHYEMKKKLLLKTEHQDISDYLDKLLWEVPKDSFIPHSLSLPSDSFIIISDLPIIDPSMCSIFNFTKQPITTSVSKIYEIDDSTSLERKEIFENKYRYYSREGYHLISL